MIPFRKTSYKYALWGALFGLLFPILATILESRENYGKVDFSSIFASQQNSALLWIINTAPFFLGLFAYLIGRQADATQLKNREILRAQQQLILQEKMDGPPTSHAGATDAVAIKTF